MMSKGIRRSCPDRRRTREGDADAVEDQVGFGALGRDRVGALRVEPGMEGAIVRAHAAVGVHLVVERACHCLGMFTRTIMAKTSVAIGRVIVLHACSCTP